MIKLTELKDTENPGVRLRGTAAEDANLDLLSELLLNANENEYGLPISIQKDTVKSGSLLKPVLEDCLLITNEDHPTDYFKYCLLLRRQGKMATVAMFYYGTSVLTGKMNRAAERKNSGTLRGMVANAVFGPDQTAYEAEYEYYNMLEQLFEEVFQ